jgi:hypothetical protein
LIKILRNLPTGDQLFGQKLGRLKPGFYCDRGILFSKRGKARVPMPIFRYFTIVGSALLAFIFVSDAYFGDHEGNPRFNGSLNESAVYAPRLQEVVATRELRFTRDVTPAARVREAFAQYVPNDGKRWTSAAAFGDTKSNSHFSGSLPERAVYAPGWDKVAAKPEPSFTPDITPAARIREAFAQFVPDDGKRWKRYSSAAMVTQ